MGAPCLVSGWVSTFEDEFARENQNVVKILHAAVDHTQFENRMEILRFHGLAGWVPSYAQDGS